MKLLRICGGGGESVKKMFKEVKSCLTALSSLGSFTENTKTYLVR